MLMQKFGLPTSKFGERDQKVRAHFAMPNSKFFTSIHLNFW